MPDSLPPLNWLRAFEASARHLSFTGAARELNMTQSAVSQQIKSLETYLKRPLFIRRPRALEITEVGRNYLPVVQEAFATLAGGTRELLGGERGQRLTVQSNLAFSVHWLAPRLPSLFAAHPWLALDVVTAIWDPERTAPAADLEIRFGLGLDKEPGATVLARPMGYPVCAPDLVAEARADWRAMPLLDTGGMSANWADFGRARGEPLPDRKPIHHATTFAITFSAAMAGAGLAMAHDVLVTDLLTENRLARPFETVLTMRETYCLMTPPGHIETPASRAFIDWISERLTE